MKKLFVVLFLFLVSFSVFAKNTEDNKLTTIAKVILCENYNDFEDQLRILSVIHNRAVKKYNKASIENYFKVVSEKYQFNCYGVSRYYSEVKIWLISNAVKDMIKGNLYPVFEATHFFNRRLSKPAWKDKLKVVFVSKHHVFLA